MTNDELTAAHVAFRNQLIETGWLVPTAIDGLYGRSGQFESVVEGIDRIVNELGIDQQARVVRYPPVFPTEVFELTDYLASFPDLTGSIHSFHGDDKDHAKLLSVHAEGGDWTEFLEPSGLMLVSAACHPCYPSLTGTLPEGGTKLDVYGYCFRHEPSLDPSRMQAFRMHEYVYVGTPEGALAHREQWIPRGLELLSQLGLAPETQVANDPFFGRAGRMLAANQRSGELKFELCVQIYPGQDTAVISANYHEDHFGKPFKILTADGEVAHSSCVGFGMERITLALIAQHGLAVDDWPADVRALLWP